MKIQTNIKKVSVLFIGLIINLLAFSHVLSTSVSLKSNISKLHPDSLTNKTSLADGYGIKGKVLDVESMQPLAGVSISIPETGKTISTDANGLFNINLDKKGHYSVVSSYLGYNKETIVVDLDDNKHWENLSILLVSTSSVLDEVVVSARRAKATEMALLEERKNSNLFVEKIGAQELSRKGVSDAESAMTKMSGITKSTSDANVFVRGLGDRYNSTTLNGLVLPSENPLNKNIALDFFGTSIIQSVAVNKTFNSLLGGDVAGANIDIQSKDLSEGNFFEIGASGGINSQTIGADNLRRIDGTNWFGSLKERKSLVKDFNSYNFTNKWNTNALETPINSSFGFAGGRKFQVGTGNLNVFITGNLNSDYRYMEGVIRQTTTDGTIILDQAMQNTQYHVSKTGLANLKYAFGNNTISFNSMFINSQNQDIEQNYGLDVSREPTDKGFFRRQHVLDNNLFVNQLLADLRVSNTMKLDLGVGYNMVKADEPDRRTTKIVEDDKGGVELLGEPNSNERYYSDINERGLSTKAIATYKINGTESFDRKIQFGYQGDYVTRDFNATIFTVRIQGDRRINPDQLNNIDQIFNNSTLESGFFNLSTLSGNLTPNWYSVDKKIHSGLLSGTYQFSDKLTTVLGVRYDNVYQDVTYATNLGNTELDGPSTIKRNYVLPSLNVKYELNEKSNLRAAASLSYTLPQFAEVAYFLNTFSNHSTQGNKDLVPVENTNFDVKWEMFPTAGELISFGAFFKNLKNPIARSETGTNVMTFYNVGASANVAGLEMELKKNLWKTNTSSGENILSTGANVSYLYTNQKLQNPDALFTKDESALQGASPLLLNADLSYLVNNDKWSMTSTAVVNYFSDRIYSLGTRNFADIIEKGVVSLDFISMATINKKIGLEFKVRNLLNPNVDLVRESDTNNNITLESYRRGINVNLGVSYRF